MTDLENVLAPNDPPEQRDEPLSVSELQTLILDVLPGDLGLRPLKGFKLDLSANPDFQRAYFSAGCDCGVAALLSVEIAPDKDRSQIDAALPSLVDRLERQARAFRQMPCEAHKRMGLGPAAGGRNED